MLLPAYTDDSKVIYMKKNLAIILCLFFGMAWALPTEVVIIRHGEKPKHGDNLNCAGLNRALKLASVLPRFGNFQQIYAPRLDALNNTTVSARMFQTALPYTAKYNAKINTMYGKNNESAVAAAIRKDSGDILMVWEHNRIPLLAREFGVVNFPQSWNNNDFDSVWIITFPAGIATLKRSQENIIPSNSCLF